MSLSDLNEDERRIVLSTGVGGDGHVRPLARRPRRSRESDRDSGAGSGPNSAKSWHSHEAWAAHSLLQRKMEREETWRTPRSDRPRPSIAVEQQPPTGGDAAPRHEADEGHHQPLQLRFRDGAAPPRRTPCHSRDAGSSSSSSRGVGARSRTSSDDAVSAAATTTHSLLMPAPPETLSWAPAAAAPQLPPQNRLAWEARALRIVNRHIHLQPTVGLGNM